MITTTTIIQNINNEHDSMAMIILDPVRQRYFRGPANYYPPYFPVSTLHPVSVRRFPSFRTQPLENLSHHLWTNGFLSNPAPGENLESGNLVMETGGSRLCSQAQEGNIYFTELAERVEYGKYDSGSQSWERESCYGDRVYVSFSISVLLVSRLLLLLLVVYVPAAAICLRLAL